MSDNIKTWRERCEEHPSHESIVSDRMIQARMQEEIDDLREEIKRLQDMLYEQLGELTALRADKQMRVHIEQLKEQPR